MAASRMRLVRWAQVLIAARAVALLAILAPLLLPIPYWGRCEGGGWSLFAGPDYHPGSQTGGSGCEPISLSYLTLFRDHERTQADAYLVFALVGLALLAWELVESDRGRRPQRPGWHLVRVLAVMATAIYLAMATLTVFGPERQLLGATLVESGVAGFVLGSLAAPVVSMVARRQAARLSRAARSR